MKKYFLLFAFAAFFFTLNVTAQTPDYDKSTSDYWLDKIADPDLNYFEVVNEFDNYWEGRETVRHSGYKQFRRWQAWARYNIYADGSLKSSESDIEALQQFLKDNPTDNTIVGNWELVGPTQFPEQTFGGQCPGLGRVSALAFHPTNEQILYAGAPAGGLWKTTDYGENWFNVPIEDFPTMGVSSIVVDHTNPDIIYVGTGDRDGGLSWWHGVFKSTDGGLTWQKKNAGMGSRIINKLLMSPDNPQRLIAASNNGIYVTSNGGNSWTHALSTNFSITDMVFKPGFGYSHVVYAAGAGSIYRSLNAGFTWENKQLTGAHRTVLAVTPANPNKVYAFMTRDSKAYRMYVSDNSGEMFNWFNIQGMELEGQGGYNLDLAVDPTNENILYAGMINVFRSTNGGQNWSMFANAGQIHADQHIFEWSPFHNDILFIGNDGGVYSMLIMGNGHLIKQISDGLAIGQIYRLSTYTGNPDLLICGTQDCGSYVTSGGPWKHSHSGDGLNCEIDYENPLIMYATAQNGVISKSVNGGNDFSLIARKGYNGINQDGSWYSAFVLDHSNTNIMFAGFQDVWRSTNVKNPVPSLITWKNISKDQLSGKVIDYLFQSPADPQRLFAIDQGGERLYMTLNAHATSPTWTEITKPHPHRFAWVEPHPFDPDIIYVSVTEVILRYRISTGYWSNLTGNLPNASKLSIAYDKNSNEGLYVGTVVGVYYKNVSMNNWILFKSGLPPTAVSDLQINYHTNPPQLFAATFGRGIWKTEIYPDPRTNIKAMSGGSIVIGTNVSVYCNVKNTEPHVTTGDFYAGFYLSENSTITPSKILFAEKTVSSLDPNGQTVISSGNMLDVAMITPEIPAGTYFLGAYLDNRLEVLESNESDNAYVADKVVVIPPSPSPPGSVQASKGDYTDKIVIQWNAPPMGAGYYRVYRNSTNNSATATAISGWITQGWFEDNTAPPGVDRFYWVKASNYPQGQRASNFSNVATGWKRLGNPTNVEASDGWYPDKVLVLWVSPTNGTHFKVFRNTVNNPQTAVIISGNSWITNKFFNDVSAEQGVTYYYWVKAATNASGSRPSDFSFYDTGWKALGTGPNVSASDGAYTDKIEVSWDMISGAGFYKLFYGTTSNPANSTELTSWIAGTGYTHISATPGVVYYYWVKAAINAQGDGASAFGQFDLGWMDFIPPTNVQASAGTLIEAIHITWDPSAGANYHRVFRGNMPIWSQAQPVSKWLSVNEFTDPTPTPGRTRYYWVLAAGDTTITISERSAWCEGWAGLAAPVVTATKGVYPDKVQIIWQEVNGGTYHQVFREEAGTEVLLPLTNWNMSLNGNFEDMTAAYGVEYNYHVKAAVTNAGYRESDPGIDLGFAGECGNLIDQIPYRQVDVRGRTLQINQRVVNEGPNPITNPSQIAFALEAEAPFGDPEFFLGTITIPPLGNGDYYDVDFSVDLDGVPGGPVPTGTWYVSCHIPFDQNNCQTNLNDDYQVWEDLPFELTNAMYGIYTVGSEDCDFEALGDVLTDLALRGISYNVYFYLEPEVFSEQHTFTAVDGASESKKITFMTNPSRSDTALISFTPTDQNNYTIRLADASHFVFQNLKIATNGFSNFQSTYGRVIEIIGDCEDITISNCLLQGFGDYSHNSNNNVVIYGNNTKTNVLNITNNIILSGQTSIRLFGKDSFSEPISNLLIKDNVLDGFLADGILLMDVHYFEILSNKMTSAANIFNYNRGIDILYGFNGFNISGNEIILRPSNDVTHAVSLNSVNRSSNMPGLISNNFISVQGNGTNVYGLYLLNVAGTKVYHNSIHLFGNPGEFSGCMMLDCLGGPPTGGFNNILYNNVVSNQLGGICLSMNDEALADQYFVDIDYNNYYSTGQYQFLRHGEFEYNLAQWKNLTGFDDHSSLEHPGFYSDTDLHTNSLFLKGTGVHVPEVLTDIDGEPRNVDSPDIGADEFTYVPFYTWTGSVSTDWHTAGNWDPMQVPNSAMNVLIPADRNNMPLVDGDQAYCRDLTVEGTLTVADKQLTVAGNANFNGNLTMTNDAGTLLVKGNVNWNEGSTVNMMANAYIRVERNWNFNAGAQVQMTNGVVVFQGSQSKYIKVLSPDSRFYDIYLESCDGAYVYLDEDSVFPLVLTTMYINPGCSFVHNGNGTIKLYWLLYSYGTFYMDGGTLEFVGNNHVIFPGVNDVYNNVTFNQEGTLTISTASSGVLNIIGDLKISSGVFKPGNATIKVFGNWINEVGEGAFDESDSRVVFNGIGNTQNVTGGEVFNILEVNKQGGLLNLNDVTCAVYDFTAGGINVPAGKYFTANSLADDALYGTIRANQNSVVNLHKQGVGSIDLIGSLENLGGVVNIHGGEQSNWGVNGNAFLTMTGGVLDFKDASINIMHSGPNFFNGNITGGTIRTTGSFSSTSPYFEPEGGSVEFYGNKNSTVYLGNGSVFFNLINNKPPDMSYKTYISSALVLDGIFIESGCVQISYENELISWGSIEVMNGGTLELVSGTLSMKNGTSLEIYNDAKFICSGHLGGMSTVKGISPSNYYYLILYNGSYAEINHTIFENMSEEGLNVHAGATINPVDPFANCIFRNGKTGGTLLTINNNQFLVVNNAIFPANTWGGQHNVKKTANHGGVNFVNATGGFAGAAFEHDPYNRIFWDGDFYTYHINLPADWSGISSHVLPMDNVLENVFDPIANKVVSVQTMTGVYIPGQNINTIGNWASHSAFKVKTNEACVLPITGYYETDMVVSLNAGWNLLPVVTPDGADPVNLFMPVNGFAIVKDVAGTGVFWPQYNINSIGYIFPGKAYYVLMTAPGVVDYTGMKSSRNLTGIAETLSGLGYNITPTPATHTIAILPEALIALEQGTIISAYDQAGNCFGVTVYNSEFISLTVFGDDPTTAEKDGFFEGEMIYFKTLTGLDETLSGLIPTFDQSLPQANGQFTENGLSAITGFEAATGIGYDVFGSSISIYPNPTNGVVNITGLGSETKITVTDVRGRVVFSTEPLNSGLFSFDLSGSNPGVYFVNIQHNKQSIFRKIVLR